MDQGLYLLLLRMAVFVLYIVTHGNSCDIATQATGVLYTWQQLYYI